MPARLATPGVPALTTNGVALPATKKLVMLSGLPSTSVALFNKSPGAPSATVKVTSSVMLLFSSPSTGGLLAPIVRVKVEVSVSGFTAALSLTVYVTTGIAPT